jgi:hybrid cluster-associated redox disulfide protein
MKKEKINKKMNFAEIIKKNPDAIRILMEKGMHCVGCYASAMETLEEGAMMHGMDPDKLVEEINKSNSKK